MAKYDFASRRRLLFKTQREAAKAMGVCPHTVSRWENGSHPVPEWAKILIICLMEKRYVRKS